MQGRSYQVKTRANSTCVARKKTFLAFKDSPRNPLGHSLYICPNFSQPPILKNGLILKCIRPLTEKTNSHFYCQMSLAIQNEKRKRANCLASDKTAPPTILTSAAAAAARLRPSLWNLTYVVYTQTRRSLALRQVRTIWNREG